MKTALPPGPRDHFFGMSLMGRMRQDYLGFWREQHRRYGDTVYMRLWNYGHYTFFHPEQIREVLVEKADSFIRFEHPMRVFAQSQGQSLLVTEGETWKKQRRTLVPGFSPKRFTGYARQMTEAINASMGSLPVDGEPVEFEHTMNQLAMDVILRTMFGTRVTQDLTHIERAVRELSEIAYQEMFLPFIPPMWLPTAHNRNKRAALELLDELIWSHIRARRAKANAGDDLLGMLLGAADDDGDGSMLSDQEVRDQMMTIFLAGHETTAAGVTWAGWMLASHPEVAARATAEVDAVLAGRIPGYEDVASLPYLGAVIKETLRLRSPAIGTFLRRPTEDVRIGQWLVPKGSLVSILSFVPHTDERWFANPQHFDPERFLGDAARDIERGAYIPFGTGPRVCIGSNFATMEMTLILAMLLQRFALRPAAGQGEPKDSVQVTLRPKGGLRLVLEPRRAAPVAGTPARAASLAAGCPFH